MIGEAVEVIDGYIVRIADGEVIGRVDIPDVFRVDTREKADWVLRKLSEAEAAVVAIEIQRQAINARLDSMKRAALSRVEFLRFRFAGELEEFARAELAGGKAKTLNLPHGSIAFRMSKGTNTITDMIAAVEFVEAFVPQFVKVTRSVTVTAALEAYRSCKEDTDPETPPWIESSGPRETFKIDTGIKLDAPKSTARSSSGSTDNSATTATFPR